MQRSAARAFAGVVIIAGLALSGVAASAKSVGECQKDYAANKSAIAKSGQSMKAFLAACESGAAPAPAAAAPAAQSADAATEALAKASQNPVADMISVPFQSNTNFGVGPYNKPQEVFNIQPVIPVKLNPDWNVIVRWIAPIIGQPRLSPQDGPEFGLGNMTPSFFLSPANPGKIIWGVGPIFYLPTATDNTLGINKWGAGPTAVVLTSDGPWLYGVLANQIWAGNGPSRVNQTLIQPFINYNMPKGWFLTSAPIITANWTASSGNRWLVPLGGGFGRVFKIGDQPVNMSAQGYYDVARPTGAPSWTLRLSLALLFPTK